ncbi:uncharacterized protein LOC117330887 [Pecten maximus]|uniref:uncharacterized protein LOC117330887 n=1 Tax=Pecten maximus TaxID=6579 RepID=UPI001458AB9B|nr:uncharacterized protein LOC117330887 [Pecten maximus]
MRVGYIRGCRSRDYTTCILYTISISMKTVGIALGLLALLMAVEGSKIVDLAKKHGGSEEQSSCYACPLGLLRFLGEASDLIKQFVKNMAEIKSEIEGFGGLQGFEDYVLGDESALMYFLMVEGESEESDATPTSNPNTKSGSAKRSMKEMLALLEKFTNKK